MIGCTACADLDLNPPADASSETWFSNIEEFEFAANDLYRLDLWYWECNRAWHTDRWTDDWEQQGHGYEWSTGALMSTTGYVKTMWLNTYKAITRCNAIIANVEKQRGKLSEKQLDRFEGEARMFRACFLLLTCLPVFTFNTLFFDGSHSKPRNSVPNSTVVYPKRGSRLRKGFWRSKRGDLSIGRPSEQRNAQKSSRDGTARDLPELFLGRKELIVIRSLCSSRDLGNSSALNGIRQKTKY